MPERDKNRERLGGLDALGREIVRAAAANEDEADAVASSPFLYARVRTRVAADRARLDEADDWRAALRVFRRAVLTVAVVAVLALVLFISVLVGTTQGDARDEATLLGDGNTGVEQVVFADRSSLTSDEVLATIIEDDREAQR
jgi:anti-sigma-K factor RskA